MFYVLYTQCYRIAGGWGGGAGFLHLTPALLYMTPSPSQSYKLSTFRRHTQQFLGSSCKPITLYLFRENSSACSHRQLFNTNIQTYYFQLTQMISPVVVNT